MYDGRTTGGRRGHRPLRRSWRVADRPDMRLAARGRCLAVRHRGVVLVYRWRRARHGGHGAGRYGRLRHDPSDRTLGRWRADPSPDRTIEPTGSADPRRVGRPSAAGSADSSMGRTIQPAGSSAVARVAPVWHGRCGGAALGIRRDDDRCRMRRRGDGGTRVARDRQPIADLAAARPRSTVTRPIATIPAPVGRSTSGRPRTPSTSHDPRRSAPPPSPRMSSAECSCSASGPGWPACCPVSDVVTRPARSRRSRAI